MQIEISAFVSLEGLLNLLLLLVALYKCMFIIIIIIIISNRVEYNSGSISRE